MIQKTFLVVAFACVVSCSLQDQEKRADELEKRIEALEAYVSAINTNTIAANLLYRQNLLIAGFEPSASGYELTLTDGSVLHVTYGERIPGVAPIVGIDREGNWIISTDGGVNFSVIDKSENGLAVDGISPKVGIDADGFWIISLDGGETWEWILSDSGNPLSAKDGKMAGGSYSYYFFSNVSYDSEANALNFKLIAAVSCGTASKAIRAKVPAQRLHPWLHFIDFC